MTATLTDVTSPFGTYRAEGLVKAAWRLADRHDLSASLRKRIRSLVARFFAGPYDTEAEGLKFRIYPGANYDDRKILAKGRLPERAEHKLLAAHLSTGTCFVDVGANIGSYSLFAASRGAEVLAVEANPETAAKLRFNAAANGFSGVIRIAETAVGAEAGELDLWSEPSNCGFATLVPDLTTGEWAGDWRPTRVPVRPLADVVVQAGLTRIDVMKVDVEGFEDRVLLPFLKSSPRDLWPRVILLETNCRSHWAEDCLALLPALGYGNAGETDDNTVFALT
ncbi:FkbM family methyltransferase [Roseibium aestuarii]|uniref:FkbM family methyltransferase n=1 Tax=Roseibium aestuarii TaxID=2600299 RepID=A0ABW4JYJ1_9HYPH|nr:FkbM family methyltransferase [Roseibium aestuarii]